MGIFNKFINGCKKFLFEKKGNDITFGTDFLALLRIGCIGGILFGSGCLLILVFIFHAMALAIATGLLLLGFLIILLVTFYQQHHYIVTVYVFCILITVMLTLFAIWFGIQPGYHLGIVLMSFVLFYQTDTRKYKHAEFLASVLFIVYSFALWYSVVFYGERLPVSKQDKFLLSFGFLLWFGISAITLAWFYHIKFAKKEENLLQYNSKLQEMTKLDALTKLNNRRGITDVVKKLSKSSTELYFIMCDIDFFKKVNDTYGHDIGDRVLVKVSEIISNNISQDATVGRWGGEEFLIVIPNKTQQQVIDTMESIRMKIARETFVVVEGKEFFVTMTFGIAEHYFDKYTTDESIKRADENLYLGKQRGRNCVMF